MHRSWEKKQEQRLKDEQLKAKLKELQEAKEAEKRAKIERIKERRAKKEEKERYERLAAVMHAKKVERLKRREKRNKLYIRILSCIMTSLFFWFSVPSKNLYRRYIADMARDRATTHGSLLRAVSSSVNSTRTTCVNWTTWRSQHVSPAGSTSLATIHATGERAAPSCPNAWDRHPHSATIITKS
ncbi:hypothetical protein KL938_001839 [Ogataea parapolymorpha]|nr:hypothetical protein KL938_001839 [Ogataea parapolymorpha]